MSRRTTLFVSLAVVVAAVAAYIIIRNLPEKPYEPPPRQERIVHLNILSKDIESIRLVRGEDDVLELNRVETEEDGETKSVWTISEPTIAFTPKRTALSDIVYSMSNIYSNQVIEESPKELAVYGLDAPIARATVRSIEEDDVTVTVGKKTPTGVSYYVRINDSETVYSMRKYTVDKIFTVIDDFREATIPAPNLQALAYFRIEGERTIEIEQIEEEEGSDLAFSSPLRLTQPYDGLRPIDTQRFQETVETIPPSFMIADFVEDAPADLSKYGLDDPRYEFEVRDAEENSLHLLFGDEASETHAYAKLADDTLVFTLPISALQFLQVDPFTLVSKFLLIVDINRVDSFAVSRGETTHTARIDRTNYDEEAKEGEVFYLDEVEIAEDPFKDFYQAVIGLLTDAENPDQQPLTTADVSIEYALNEKVNVSSARLDLVEVNKDFYAAYIDGESEFLVSDYQVEAIFNTAAAVLKNPAGE